MKASSSRWEPKPSAIVLVAFLSVVGTVALSGCSDDEGDLGQSDYLPTHNKFYKLFIDNFSDHLSHESAAPGDYIWIDDVYVDKSWARVMICDSDTYDSCSKKMEIQPPVLWSDVSLTITFNAGEYSSGNTAYVYVFDGANRVSNGFEITID